MKRNILLLAGMAAASLMVSCQKEEGPQNVQNTQKLITRTIAVEEGVWSDEVTKSEYVPGTGISFTGKEVMSIFYADNADKNLKKTKIKPNDTKIGDKITLLEKGKYEVTHASLENVDAYDYYFMLSGNQAEIGGSAKKLLVSKVGTFQEPTETSFDPAFDALIGKPVYNQSKAQQTPFVVNQFKRIVAPTRINLKDNGNKLAGQKPILVSLSFDDEKGRGAVLSGNGYVAIPSDVYSEVGVESVSSDSWSNTVVAHYKNGLQGNQVWFNLFPATIKKGNMTLSVTTADKTYTRSVALAEPFKLLEGKLNEFSFNISGEGVKEVESLYQDFSDFQPDDVKALPATLKLAASDGTEHNWGFTNCNLERGKNSVYSNKTLKIYPQGVYFNKAKTSKITFPTDLAPVGKKVSKVTIYFHPVDKKKSIGPASTPEEKQKERHALVLTAADGEGWDKGFTASFDKEIIVGIAFEFAPAQ